MWSALLPIPVVTADVADRQQRANSRPVSVFPGQHPRQSEAPSLHVLTSRQFDLTHTDQSLPLGATDPFVKSFFAGVHIPYICSPPLSALAVLRHGSARRTFHKSSGSEFFLALRRLLCARSPLSRDGPFLRAFSALTCLVPSFDSLGSPFENLR